MRTHYGPWQPCWISNQHQKHKSGRGPSSEHFWQVWLKSVQRFQRRRFKCEKLTDGRTDDYPWQKLTWPMARWAKNVSNCLKNPIQISTKSHTPPPPPPLQVKWLFPYEIKNVCFLSHSCLLGQINFIFRISSPPSPLFFASIS